MTISTLKNRQILAIQYVITSQTLEDACKKARISKGTLYAWLKEDVFKNELKRQRDEILGQSLDRLKYAMKQAIEGLIELMASPRPDLRRWVYKDIIDYGLKSIELQDIKERIDKIEERVNQEGQIGYPKTFKQN